MLLGSQPMFLPSPGRCRQWSGHRGPSSGRQSCAPRPGTARVASAPAPGTHGPHNGAPPAKSPGQLGSGSDSTTWLWARTHQAHAPSKYLCTKWVHVLQVAGKGYHLVHEGFQGVLCQPVLGAQDPEERLGERMRGGNLLTVSFPSSRPPAQCMAPDRRVLGLGTQQEETLGGVYLNPFSTQYTGDIFPTTNFVTRPFPRALSSRGQGLGLSLWPGLTG